MISVGPLGDESIMVCIYCILYFHAVQCRNFDSSLAYRNDSAVESDLAEKNLSTTGNISNENASARNNQPIKRIEPNNCLMLF